MVVPPNMSASNSALHRLWVKVREPFVVPSSICLHSDGWEIYDMHMAGCRRCGSMHLCQHVSCPTFLNTEGFSVCNITGLCTPRLNVSNVEYMDTIQSMQYTHQYDQASSTDRPPRVSRKKRFKYIAQNRQHRPHIMCTDNEYEKIDDLITSFVCDVLCSEQWIISNDMEHRRYTAKWTSSFTKVRITCCVC